MRLLLALLPALAFPQYEPNTLILGEYKPTEILHVRNSPGITVDSGTYAGIIVENSPHATIRNNRIVQPAGGREGILVWGSDYALVENNIIQGVYGNFETGSNDAIQVMPNPDGKTGNLGADRWWEGPKRNLPGFRYIESGALFYGFQESRFIRGVIVRNNRVYSSGRAGVFAYNTVDCVFEGNEIHDTFDAALTIEQSVGAKVLGNSGTFHQERLKNGLYGGIAALFLADRMIVRGNVFEGQDYRFYSNSHPMTDVVVSNNVGHTFVIKPTGKGEPWVERMTREGNSFEREIVVPGKLPVAAVVD